MRIVLSTAIVAIALSGFASAYAEAYPSAQVSQSQSNPSDGLSLKTPTYAGCFSNSGSLVDQGLYTYQALGWCQPWCVRQNLPVIGFSNGTNCWCGNKLPPASDKVDDSECSVPCNGYDKDKCGGLHAYAVWNDGLLVQVDSDSSELYPTSSATSTSVASTTAITVPSTVYITAPGSTSAQVVYTTETAQPASGPNKAAIAAGVVVSVVLVCAFVGGLMFWLRQKRRRELEEEHRRREKPSSLSSSSLPDSRLEPSVMFQRRQSDGSIADNQDYSRRILKVTNPDNRDSRVI